MSPKFQSKDVNWAEWPEALVEDRMILESEFVIPSATVPPTQVGLIVRTEAPGEETGESAPAATEAAATPPAEEEEGAVDKKAEKKGDKKTAKKDDKKAKEAEPEPEQEPTQMASAENGNAESEIVGAVARRRILMNEPISPDALINRGDRSVGSAVVSPGMRAISIKISADTGAGGFIAPGDYVDVLLSIAHEIKLTGPDGKPESTEGRAVTLPDGDSLVKYTTETVMRNVKVLAIDQSLARDEDSGPADVGKTATLEVSPRDAEKLLTAGQLGSLTLVLRSMVVDQTVQDEVDAFEDPFNFVSDVATSRAVAAIFTSSSLYGGGPAGSVVRVNRGGAISQEGF